MADLSTTRNYDDGHVLVRADLDAFLDDIETFINVTKINDDNIQDSGITASTKLLNQSVTEQKLASNSVSTLKIQDGTITTAKIAASNITTSLIAASNITTSLIADQNVTTGKIADAAVTTAKLATNSVTSTILSNDPTVDANRAVTTNSIQDHAVTAAKIADGVITPGKFATNFATGTFSGGAGTYSLGSTITTSGRPVIILVYGGTTNSGGTLTLKRNDGFTDTSIGTLVQIEDAAGANPTLPLYAHLLNGASAGARPTGAPSLFVDIPSAGTYTYKLTSDGIVLNSVKVLAYEL